MTATLDELRNSLGGRSPAYDAKMMHRVPDAPVVDRAAFILEKCKGKVVLDIGASGPMHAAIVQVAAKCYGIDKPAHGKRESYEEHDGGETWLFNIDDTTCHIPRRDDVDVIVCGEVLEHLTNPGYLLTRLRKQYACPLIVSVPNAFSDIARHHMERGVENCNIEHTCWYSFHTLSELLCRSGYEIAERCWYNGRPRFAEGMIVLASPLVIVTAEDHL